MDILANACADVSKYAGLQRVVRALQNAYRQKLIRRPFQSQFLGLVAQVHRQRSVKARLKKYHQTNRLRQTARKVASLIDRHVHRPGIFKQLNIKLSETDEEHAVGYLSEGNEAFYTSSAILRRCFLVRDLSIREVTAMFWTLASEDGKTLTKHEYKTLLVYIAKVLVSGALSDEEIEAAIDHDWSKDLKKSRIANKDATASTISPADLHCSLYELADVWVDGINGAKYAGFLKNLLYSVALRTKRGRWLFRDLGQVASIMDKDGNVDFAALSKARLSVITDPDEEYFHQMQRKRQEAAASRLTNPRQQRGTGTRSQPQGRFKQSAPPVSHSQSQRKHVVHQKHVQQRQLVEQAAVSVGNIQLSATTTVHATSHEPRSKPPGQKSTIHKGSPVPRKTLAVGSPDRDIGLRSGGRKAGHGSRNSRQRHKKTAPRYVYSSPTNTHAGPTKSTSTFRQASACAPAFQIRALDCGAEHDQHISSPEQRTRHQRPHTQQSHSRGYHPQQQGPTAGAVGSSTRSTSFESGSPPAASRGRSTSSGTLEGQSSFGQWPSRGGAGGGGGAHEAPRQHSASFDSYTQAEESTGTAGSRGTAFAPAPIELQLPDNPALQSHSNRGGKHVQDADAPRTFGAHFTSPARRQRLQRSSQHPHGLQDQSRQRKQSLDKDDSFEVYYSPQRRNLGAAMTSRRRIFKSSLSRTCDSNLLERAQSVERNDAAAAASHSAGDSAGCGGSRSLSSSPSAPSRNRPSTVQQQSFVHSAQVTGLRSFLPPTEEMEDFRNLQFSGARPQGGSSSPTWGNSPRGFRGHVRRSSDPSPVAAHTRHAGHHRGWSMSSHPLPELKVSSPDSREDLSPIERPERVSPVAQARKELVV